MLMLSLTGDEVVGKEKGTGTGTTQHCLPGAGLHCFAASHYATVFFSHECTVFTFFDEQVRQTLLKLVLLLMMCC